MKADTLTPQSLFGQTVRYVVPLFQRPYVWTREDQWEPLWQDVRSVAERLEEAQGMHEVPPHFLGAIVLDHEPTGTAYIQVRHVIDGQQRLTTLQLLLDATQVVVEEHGHNTDSQALQLLVLNQAALAHEPTEVFKVWPTDRDQAVFQATMDNDTVVPAELVAEPIAAAHAFFVEEITKWSGAGSAQPERVRERLHTLTMALHSRLKMVVIDLEPGDNAQVIFETLNHRGSPLLAADLIKNLVFQRAVEQGLTPLPLYQQYWKHVDGKHWRTKVARGRQYVPRIDIFANYWLVMRLAREIPSDRIFAEFRERVATQDSDVAALLKEFSADANVFAGWENLPADSVPGVFRYRILQAMDTGVVSPIFLWLTRWPNTVLPVEQRDKALKALESWLVRRMLCRLTAKDLNRTLLDLLQELKAQPVANAGDVTTEFLTRQTAESRYWPSDDAVRATLVDEPLYRALLRARLRMVLEALEDDMRTSMSEAPCPRNLTVEHIMPQAWRDHWNAANLDPTASLLRDQLIHTLGNLTLVNPKLNSHLSNHPWTKEEAAQRSLRDGGKYDRLLANTTIKLNAELLQHHQTEWTESDIRHRTASLIERILRIWPRPQSNLPQHVEETVTEPADKAESDQPKPPSFATLTEWLSAQQQTELPMHFTDLEDVLGAELPTDARTVYEFWAPDSDIGVALKTAGYKATGVSLAEERVTFMLDRL